MTDGLDEALRTGVIEGVFPLARAEVWCAGKPVYAGGNADSQTHFDLASMTKVLCTSAVVLRARCDLATPVGKVLPGASTAGTLDDLLFHRAGYPDHVPLFLRALEEQPELLDADCPPAVRIEARHRTSLRAVAQPCAPLGRALYSDIGFIVAGAFLEAVCGDPLDALFKVFVAEPLGLATGFRRLSATPALALCLAPTQTERPREPAPNQRGWAAGPKRQELGQVDDDNAWVMDGVAGNAGLFGTASDVARFGNAVLEGFLGSPSSFASDLASGGLRSRGFDTPSSDGATCGARFGRAGPLGAIGHTGFTGTSLWIDLDRKIVAVLLTNRVALGRGNTKIRAFRPRFYDLALAACETP